MRIMEKPKMDKNRKFLCGICLSKAPKGETSMAAGTNPHFLQFSHTVHIRAVGCVSSLTVSIVVEIDGYAIVMVSFLSIG